MRRLRVEDCGIEPLRCSLDTPRMATCSNTDRTRSKIMKSSEKLRISLCESLAKASRETTERRKSLVESVVKKEHLRHKNFSKITADIVSKKEEGKLTGAIHRTIGAHDHSERRITHTPGRNSAKSHPLAFTDLKRCSLVSMVLKLDHEALFPKFGFLEEKPMKALGPHLGLQRIDLQRKMHEMQQEVRESSRLTANHGFSDQLRESMRTHPSPLQESVMLDDQFLARVRRMSNPSIRNKSKRI